MLISPSDVAGWLTRGAAAIGLALAVQGCAIGSESRSYPGADVNTLFDTAVSVAEDRSAPNWLVTENNVWVSRGERRIELFRVLERELVRDGAPREEQRQTWSMTMWVMAAAPEGDPVTGEIRNDPEVRIESRSSRPPAQFWVHADAMFDAIESRLDDPPRPRKTVAPAEAGRARPVAPSGTLQSP